MKPHIMLACTFCGVPLWTCSSEGADGMPGLTMCGETWREAWENWKKGYDNLRFLLSFERAFPVPVVGHA